MAQVFLSYSRKDLAFVERLAADLKEAGFDVWYDLSDLVGGDRWSQAIQQAIQNSQYVILVLSPDSVVSKWVEREFFFSEDINKKIIPVYYISCNLGLNYNHLHYIDVQGEKYKQNFNQILRALNVQPKPPTPVEEKKPVVEKPKPAQRITPQPVVGRASSPAEVPSRAERSPALSVKAVSKGRSVEIQPRPSTSLRTNETPPNKFTLSNGMDFMRVPAGRFLMGSDKGRDNEKPQRTVDIPYDYWTARFPLTNEQYNLYAKAKDIKHPVDGWEKKKDHPVVYVNWTDTMAYCQWLNDLLKGELPAGLVLRLPTEAEWEKAARGGKGNEYPWGNEFDKNKCNSREGGKSGTTSVGSYSPRGDSPYGCADMSGNVWEWTHSLYKPYPYTAGDGREDEKVAGDRSLRGGSWFDDGVDARVSFRYLSRPDFRYYSIGFRVFVSLPNRHS